MTEKKPIRRPDWLDKDHSEWPPEARIAFGILATIAERRLAEQNAGRKEEKSGGVKQ